MADRGNVDNDASSTDESSTSTMSTRNKDFSDPLPPQSSNHVRVASAEEVDDYDDEKEEKQYRKPFVVLFLWLVLLLPYQLNLSVIDDKVDSLVWYKLLVIGGMVNLLLVILSTVWLYFQMDSMLITSNNSKSAHMSRNTSKRNTNIDNQE